MLDKDGRPRRTLIMIEFTSSLTLNCDLEHHHERNGQTGTGQKLDNNVNTSLYAIGKAQEHHSWKYVAIHDSPRSGWRLARTRQPMPGKARIITARNFTEKLMMPHINVRALRTLCIALLFRAHRALSGEWALITGHFNAFIGINNDYHYHFRRPREDRGFP